MPQHETQLDSPLPGYAPELAAYHRAFRQELCVLLDRLPLAPQGSVLDVACGDAFYGRALRQLGRAGLVVAIDISHRWLREAARGGGDCPALCQGSASRLPFCDHRFDLVWCAQSLYSLPDLRATLEEMRRVARRGGVVAVLEDDALHQVLLPWPAPLELAIRKAEYEAFARQSDWPAKFYIGRHMIRMLREAGLRQVSRTAWATSRQAPLTDDERTFLLEYLRSLGRRVKPYLGSAEMAEFNTYADPNRDESLAHDPDLTITCIDFVVCGIKP